MSTVVSKKVVCDNCGKEIIKGDRGPNPMMLSTGNFTMRLEIWDGTHEGYADLCRECFEKLMGEALKHRLIPIDPLDT